MGHCFVRCCVFFSTCIFLHLYICNFLYLYICTHFGPCSAWRSRRGALCVVACFVYSYICNFVYLLSCIFYTCIFVYILEGGIVRCCVFRKKQCFASPSSIIMNSPQFKPKCSNRKRRKEKKSDK